MFLRVTNDKWKNVKRKTLKIIFFIIYSLFSLTKLMLKSSTSGVKFKPVDFLEIKYKSVMVSSYFLIILDFIKIAK